MLLGHDAGDLVKKVFAAGPSELLGPARFNRLLQIMLQVYLRRSLRGSLSVVDAIGEELELNATEKQQLMTRAKQVRDAVQEEDRALKKQELLLGKSEDVIVRIAVSQRYADGMSVIQHRKQGE